MMRKKEVEHVELPKVFKWPFTDAVEVEECLAEPTISTKVKQQRRKLDIHFARESTTLILKLTHCFGSNSLCQMERGG